MHRHFPEAGAVPRTPRDSRGQSGRQDQLEYALLCMDGSKCLSHGLQAFAEGERYPQGRYGMVGHGSTQKNFGAETFLRCSVAQAVWQAKGGRVALGMTARSASCGRARSHAT